MLEERKLQKAKISLMRNKNFALLQGVMMIGRTHVADNVPTACTNGRDETYGREFVKKLRDAELCFVIAHEAGHKMYRHLTTWKKLHDEDARLANVACDHVINLMLKDLDPSESVIAMPIYRDGPHMGKPMGMCDMRFKNMNSKQVFDILKQEKKDKGDGEGGGPGGEGVDDHDWDGAGDMTEEEKRELARDIDQAIRQGLMAHNKNAGEGSGGLDRELQEMLEPKVNWREVLRDYVKSMCHSKDASSWRRVNRRFLSTGVYMPSMIGEKVGHLVVAVDTSGSIGQEELSEFLAEVKGIAEEVSPELVDLIYWDSAVAAHETYTEAEVPNIVSSTKPRGGGGTSPSCVSDYLKEKAIGPQCIIILTDGYVGNDWGNDWTAPVMWAIVGGSDVVAPNGKTIHIQN
jgi:predicted metal-dependent peptidase